MNIDTGKLDKLSLQRVAAYFTRLEKELGTQEAALLEKEYWKHRYVTDVSTITELVRFKVEQIGGRWGSSDKAHLELAFAAVLDVGLTKDDDIAQLNQLLRENPEYFSEFFQEISLAADAHNSQHIKVLAELSVLKEFFYAFYMHFTVGEVAAFAKALAEEGLSYKTQLTTLLGDLEDFGDFLEEETFAIKFLASASGADMAELVTRYSVLEEYLDENV